MRDAAKKEKLMMMIEGVCDWALERLWGRFLEVICILSFFQAVLYLHPFTEKKMMKGRIWLGVGQTVGAAS